MPIRPKIPPPSDPSGGRPGASRPADDKIAEELVEPAQPHDQDGVTEGMATLAVNPGILEGGNSQAVPHGSTNFADMEDSAIMLELRAGNMAGFDYLIQKYRKPIVSFMYRMVRNQAVAEELAQEVFLRVYRSRETY